jgi:hypothetical protein
MKLVRAIALTALGFLSVTSVVGAIPMIVNPHGKPWQMPQSFLVHSPFNSFLIPGIILLLANGVLSLFVLVETVRRRNGYGWWVALQGCVLCGWIGVEVAILRMAIWPHYFYGAIGLALIVAGCALARACRVA